MRVKAFSLIEIIVVIILIGIIFSLVISTYVSSDKQDSMVSIKDISVKAKEDATLYIYGKECEKAILELEDGYYAQSSNFNFTKEDRVMKRSRANLLEEVSFDSHSIEDKRENICLKLGFRDGKFFEKFVILSKKNYYLFSPLKQSAEKFSSLKDTEKSYQNDEIYPTSIDDYYRE